MEKSLLWEALEQLTPPERKRFTAFVHSPYFNSQPQVATFFDRLAAQTWEKGRLQNKEALHQQLYPGRPYDDHRVRLLMSKLLKLLEGFWQVECLEPQHPWARVSAYRKRSLPRHFRRAVRQARERLEQQPGRSDTYYFNQYLLSAETYRHLAQQKRAHPLNLEETALQLDAFYSIAKLRQACLAKSHQMVYPAEYQLGLVEDLVDYLSESPLREAPAVAAYYHGYHFLYEKERQAYHFQQYLALIDGAAAQVFPDEERQDLFLLALNFCTRQYNQGSRGYLNAQLRLYQIGLEQKFLLQNGQLSRFTYRNITTLGLILEAYDWVEQFLEAYRLYLPPGEQESMYALCAARLHYAKGAFDKALDSLQQAHFTEPLLQLSARTVVLKIFYETGAYDALESQLSALSKFIRRKKTLSYHRANYKNMLYYIQQLLELTPFDKKAKNKLAKQIETCPNVAERAWLQQQLKKN